MTVSQCWSVIHTKFYLIKGSEGPEPGDEGVDEAGGDVPPLPSLLLVVGGGRRDEVTGEDVGEKEGSCSRENCA